jgi:O-methyltransferase
MKNFIKKIINLFGYKIISNNDWLKKNENYIAEISEDELLILNNIKDYTMTSVPSQWSLIQSIKHIVRNNVEGDFVECGIFRGGNIIIMSQFLDNFKLKKNIYAYDTFEGMPLPGNEDLDLRGNNSIVKFLELKNNQNEGSKWCYCDINVVKNNIKKFNEEYLKKINFVKGKVEETLLDARNLPKKISLLRLDTDFYSSTKTELNILYPLLQKKGVLIIDDYGHFKGAKKAVDEFFDINRIWLHRVDYSTRIYIKD